MPFYDSEGNVVGGRGRGKTIIIDGSGGTKQEYNQRLYQDMQDRQAREAELARKEGRIGTIGTIGGVWAWLCRLLGLK